MKVAKQAVQYYCNVTNKSWEDFFTDMDIYESNKDLASTDSNFWLLEKLLGVVQKTLSLADLRANKDEIKSAFDNEGRKNAGEFFTPLVWANEARGYFDKYIPDWRTDYKIWECCAGTGNLLKESDGDKSNLYLSTLQDGDVDVLKRMPEFEGSHIFQLDFLDGLDYDTINTEFLNRLPEDLKHAIQNDEKIIIFSNPPYKSGMAKVTEVGRYMCQIGLNKSAYDLFYQCCWRIMHFVEMFNLHNMYYCFFGPLTFFTGSSAQVLYREFERCFEFIDGMCISAQDFSGTSGIIEWGIGCTLWKSRGGYNTEVHHKGVLLQKKVLGTHGEVVCGERTLYTAPRERMDEWVKPKDVLFFKEMPVATSFLTFKGSEEFDLTAKFTGKMAENALGTMMLDSTLARGNTYSAILSLPTSITYENITEENFWRCVSSYSYRNIVQAGWADTRKWISAPDEGVDGYEEFIRNSIVILLFELKSMQTGLRGINWQGELIDISNRLFPLSEKEIRENCTDNVVLEDLDKHGLHNNFMLEQIELSRGYWTPEIAELYNWCTAFMKYSLNNRGIVDYKGCLNACDAGFAQIRSGLFTQELNSDLFKKLQAARGSINKELGKFGFLCETEGISSK